jgi:hypothetical protein
MEFSGGSFYLLNKEMKGRPMKKKFMGYGHLAFFTV